MSGPPSPNPGEPKTPEDETSQKPDSSLSPADQMPSSERLASEKVAQDQTTSSPTPEADAQRAPARPLWQQGLLHLHLAVVFLTRLPMPRLPADCPSLARAAWTFPLVGLVIGAVCGGVLWVTEAWGLPAVVTALLAVGVGVLLTGGLHEDGLADVADGFGGGVTRSDKMEIMRDSRIGSYGVIALILVFGLRVAALAEMPSAALAAFALTVAHTVGRAMIPLAMTVIRPARADGLGASAGRPPLLGTVVALGVALILSAFALGFGVVDVFLVALLATLLVTWVAHRQIGGYTGDVLGAVAVVGDVMVLLTLSAMWGEV